MEVKKISDKEFEDAKKLKPEKGKWKQIIKEVTEKGGAVKITGLKRGQVSAAYRSVDKEQVEAVFSYAKGEVYLKAKPKKEKKKELPEAALPADVVAKVP